MCKNIKFLLRTNKHTNFLNSFFKSVGSKKKKIEEIKTGKNFGKVLILFIKYK